MLYRLFYALATAVSFATDEADEADEADTLEDGSDARRLLVASSPPRYVARAHGHMGASPQISNPCKAGSRTRLVTDRGGCGASR